MLVDTHAHLYWDSYKEDFDEVLQRSIDTDVSVIVNVGVDVQKSKTASELETDKLKFYSTIGIHPHEATKYSQNPDELITRDISTLERIFVHHKDKVIGVGECGLDFLFEYNTDFIPTGLSIERLKDLQRKLFQAQIDLAKKLNLPLIIHCRDDRSTNPENSKCWDEVLDMIKGWKGILHCYSGLTHNTKYILHNTDFYVSFAGNITYPQNNYLREAVKFLPLEKILLETDCPFLAPQSIRGQRNEPSKVLEIAQLIADLKNVPFEKVSTQTTLNFKRLFSFLQ